MSDPQLFTVFRTFTGVETCTIRAASAEQAVELAVESKHWEDTYERDATDEPDEVHDEHGNSVWP